VLDREEAQALANEGHPVIASFKNPARRPDGRYRSGHVAIIRPGEMTSQGPAVAQAGAKNFNHGRWAGIVRRGTPVELWVSGGRAGT
jgi:hypothetical protein